ncbi:MAG: hypothetical protein ABH864_04980 [archaeon]
MPKKRKKATSSREKSDDKDTIVLELKAKKKTTRKKRKKRKVATVRTIAHPRTVIKTTHADREIEHAILKNLVELQKVQTDLSEKFSHLAKEISHLLALFEVTARNFAKNVPENDQYTKDKEFLEKIDKLLDQNKTLAKGLTLMEERMRERIYSTPSKTAPEKKKPEEQQFTPSMTTRNRPLPRF